MANEMGFTSLGLILLDTMTPECQYAHEGQDMSLYEGKSIFESSIEIEKMITVDEKQRAAALEVILKYDSL